MIEELLDTFQPREVVEIVRCIDCCYYDPIGIERTFPCPIGMDDVKPFEFCSRGRMKGDRNETD